MKVAIIGTGLSAYGSIKAMIDKKIKPHVFDIGAEEEKAITLFKKKLSSKKPNSWNKYDFSAMEKSFFNFGSISGMILTYIINLFFSVINRFFIIYSHLIGSNNIYFFYSKEV